MDRVAIIKLCDQSGIGKYYLGLGILKMEITRNNLVCIYEGCKVFALKLEGKSIDGVFCAIQSPSFKRAVN